MEIRDAVEGDAPALAAASDASEDAMVSLVHDRTVRVAVEESGDAGPNADAATDPGMELQGFVSFDVRRETVHVTRLDGTSEARERLLAEPVRFASAEGLPVELIVEERDETSRDAATAVGFDQVGPGPQFAGQPTVRYRLEPESAPQR